jgi:AcrR family transcriptional regulator
MRRLASALGSSPMAIYHHVEGRADLLIAVLGELSAEIPRPELPTDPVERMIAVSEHTRATMVAMPWIVEVIRTNVAFGKGGMWTVDLFIEAGTAVGMTDEQTMELYFAVWRYIVGDVIVAAQPPAKLVETDAPVEPAWHERIAAEDLGDLPHFARVRAQWQDFREAYDSQQQLATLIRSCVAVKLAEQSAPAL